MFRRILPILGGTRGDDIVKHGLIMAGFTFAHGLFSYLYQLAMGRMLQPADFGILLSLTNLFLIISVFSLTIRTAMTKYISKYHAAGNMEVVGYLWRVYLKRTLILGVAAFFIAALVSPAISGFLRIGNVWYPLVVFSSLVFAFAVPLNWGTLNGLHRFIPLGWTYAFWVLLRLVLAILLIKLGLGLYGGLAPYIIAYVIVLAITYYYLKGLPTGHGSKAEVIGVRSYVSLSFLAILSYTMLTNVDIVLVRHFLDEGQAGNYAAVATLGRVALFAPVGIALAMFPKSSGLHESGKSHRAVLLMSVLLTTVITGAIVAIYSAFPDFFVNLLGVDKYTLAAPYLFNYSLAIMFLAVSYIFMNYFLSLNRVQVAYVFAAVALLQVLLILYFHRDIGQVVNSVLISGAVCLFVTLLFYQWSQRPRPPKKQEANEGC